MSAHAGRLKAAVWRCLLPGRRGLPWSRLGLAGALVLACALSGLGWHCDDMPGGGFAVLLALQGTTALGSLGMSLVACMRHDWPGARKEALVGGAMLAVIPLGFFAYVSLLPECACG